MPGGRSSGPNESAPYVLTIDVGTSSARAMLFDSQGQAVEGMVAREQHPMHVRPDGAVEDDMDHVMDRVVTVIDRLLIRAEPLAGQIGALAMGTLVSNVLGVDADGRPVTPVYTYGDTRPAPDVGTLRGLLNEEETHERTGCRFHTSYLPARFLWLERIDPERFESVRRWMSVGEYVYQQFFGRTACSYSVASWSGLLNRHRLTWDDEVLAVLPIRLDQLSELTDAGRPFHGLSSEWAGRWPALRDLPWFPAIGDGAAANIGSGCTAPDRVALTVGTSGAMRVVLPGTPDHLPADLWCYRVDGRRSLLGGALSEGGNVMTWARQTLQLGSVRAVEEQLQSMEPDAHGLTVLPFLAGERSPGWQPEARAVLSGLSLATHPVDMLRALLEAVAYRFAIVDEVLRAAAPDAGEIIASGGGLLSSPAWLQIMADVLGRPIHVSEEVETTSRGAALLALESLGVLANVGDVPVTLGPTYEPDEARHARYRAALTRQQNLYAAIGAQ